MSDTSQGPGWWLASDGKWYPPEQWTGPPDTSPPCTGAPTGPTTTPAQPWGPDLGTAAVPVTGQPGPTWPTGSTGEPGVQGQPPAYGANPWPGAAPPAHPGYGTNPYGTDPYGQPGYGPAPYVQAGYGPAPYGQAGYGATPYGQPAYVGAGRCLDQRARHRLVRSFRSSVSSSFTIIVAIVLGFVARGPDQELGRTAEG